MQITDDTLSQYLNLLVEELDVPKSYYDKASARHKSLGEWLHRKDSAVAQYDPDVRPQGSFRYGTVIKPINPKDSYDLDNVCLLQKLGKSVLTQKSLKDLYGKEVVAYAIANGMHAAPTEHNRCWRLNYADEASFHLDTLPCVSEEGEFVRRLIQSGVNPELAQRAIAITDRRHPRYSEITLHWPSSNPRGFAKWFEGRAALGRRRTGVLNQVRAAVEEVPPYEWKTTLQRSIQILKRHRDVMFRGNSELAPISMIITNLAAHAYNGEEDLVVALRNIVDGMPRFVQHSAPRIPNPANPAEDYAEKWSTNPLLEKSFREWLVAVRSDLNRFPRIINAAELREATNSSFLINLSQEDSQRFVPEPRVHIRSSAPTIVAPTASRPWGWNG